MFFTNAQNSMSATSLHEATRSSDLGCGIIYSRCTRTCFLQVHKQPVNGGARDHVWRARLIYDELDVSITPSIQMKKLRLVWMSP